MDARRYSSLFTLAMLIWCAEVKAERISVVRRERREGEVRR